MPARCNTAIDYGLGHDVHLALFAGDIYKHREPDPSWQRAFALCVRRLTDRHIPVVILVGNHDLPNTFGKAHAVEIFATLELPGVTVISQPGIYTLETASGPVQVAGVPYHHVAVFSCPGSSTRTRRLKKSIVCWWKKAKKSCAAWRLQVEPTLPAILTFHGSVANAILSSEQSIMMVGNDPIFPLSALTNPIWDYVALGHIHRHQDLHQGQHPPVVYSGSIERIDFGEEHEDKGFVWAEVAKGATTYTFMPVPARRFVTLRLDAREGDLLVLLDQELDHCDVQDAIVRVIVTVPADAE